MVNRDNIVLGPWHLCKGAITMKTKYLLSSTIAAIALAGAMTVATGAQAADVVTYNSTPTDGWFYGSGNDYVPSNTAVLTTDGGNQIFLRMHKTFDVAPTSDGAGVYSFALGTDPMSVDWGIDTSGSSNVTAFLAFTNVATGLETGFDPFVGQPDNSFSSGSTENSFRLNWLNVGGFGFDPNVDNTYRVQLQLIDHNNNDAVSTLNVFAKLGDGAGAGAVPEPATWAMMLIGFGGLGGVMRKRRAMATAAFAA